MGNVAPIPNQRATAVPIKKTVVAKQHLRLACPVLPKDDTGMNSYTELIYGTRLDNFPRKLIYGTSLIKKIP